MRPWRETVSAISARACGPSPVSQGMNVALPPASRIDCAVASPSSSRMSPMTTAAPSAAKRRAQAAPMPRAAPGHHRDLAFEPHPFSFTGRNRLTIWRAISSAESSPGLYQGNRPGHGADQCEPKILAARAVGQRQVVDQRAKDVLVVVALLDHPRAELRRMPARELGRDDRAVVLALVQGLDVGGAGGLQPAPGIVHRLDGREHALLDPLDAGRVNRRQQVLLGGKVVVHRAGQDAGRRGDITHRGGAVARARELHRGRVEDASPAVVPALPVGFRHSHGSFRTRRVWASVCSICPFGAL